MHASIFFSTLTTENTSRQPFAQIINSLKCKPRKFAGKNSNSLNAAGEAVSRLVDVTWSAQQYQRDKIEDKRVSI